MEFKSRIQSRRGGIISGLFLVAILVLMAILASVIIVVKTVRIRSADGHSGNGADVAITLPGGQLSIHSRDSMNPGLAGIPIYPGAYRGNDGGASIEWNSKDGDSDRDVNIVGGEFRTRDSVSQVREFYRQKLPEAVVVSKNDRSAQLEYRDGELRQIISIHRQGAETRIGVAAIGGRASN